MFLLLSQYHVRERTAFCWISHDSQTDEDFSIEWFIKSQDELFCGEIKGSSPIKGTNLKQECRAGWVFSNVH